MKYGAWKKIWIIHKKSKTPPSPSKKSQYPPSFISDLIDFFVIFWNLKISKTLKIFMQLVHISCVWREIQKKTTKIWTYVQIIGIRARPIIGIIGIGISVFFRKSVSVWYSYLKIGIGIGKVKSPKNRLESVSV